MGKRGDRETREQGQCHGHRRFGECAHIAVPLPSLTPHLRTTQHMWENTQDATPCCGEATSSSPPQPQDDGPHRIPNEQNAQAMYGPCHVA